MELCPAELPAEVTAGVCHDPGVALGTVGVDAVLSCGAVSASVSPSGDCGVSGDHGEIIVGDAPPIAGELAEEPGAPREPTPAPTD